MHACGSVPVGGSVDGGGVVGAAGGVVALAAGAEGVDVSPPELLDEFDELVLCFGGTLVAALPPLSAGVPLPSSSPDEGTVGAAQPTIAATPMLEIASSERAKSWGTAFICQILWLRSPWSVFA
jgi:hypothetical protein